jgi:hypothetical protein
MSQPRLFEQLQEDSRVTGGYVINIRLISVVIVIRPGMRDSLIMALNIECYSK